MRVDGTATLKRGERHTLSEEDEAAIELKTREVSSLLHELEDLNSLSRGLGDENENEDEGEEEGKEGERSHLVERRRLLSAIAETLSDVLSRLPPSVFLPDEPLRLFVDVARELGLLPLKRDFETPPAPPARLAPAHAPAAAPAPASVSAPETPAAPAAPAPPAAQSTPSAAQKAGEEAPRASASNGSNDSAEREKEKEGGVKDAGRSQSQSQLFYSKDLAAHAESRPAVVVASEGLRKNPSFGRHSIEHSTQQFNTAVRSEAEENFQRTTHLPLVQRIILNLPPKDAAIGLERDVTTADLTGALQDFATRPASVLKGDTPVNKTAGESHHWPPAPDSSAEWPPR